MGDLLQLASRPTRVRPVTPPPAPARWAEEIASLQEVGPELAVVLWRVLRRVRDWADTSPEERADLFRIDRGEARERLWAAGREIPELVEAFGTFALLIRAPHRVEPWLLSDACHQVHEWAEARSRVRTAMLFAEAAATADPESPERANDAGRMCRRAARDDRASSWYHRAFGLGVRHKARQETIRAQLGYGNLMKDLGEHEEARRYFEKAATRAIYTGRKRQAAEAYHDLLAIAAEAGPHWAGERYARKALDLYPRHHPRLPTLVHDWAFLLVRQHYYTPAVALLEMAVQRAHTPELKLLFESTLAWAAAGAQRRQQFEKAEHAVAQLLGLNEEFTPAALLHLAEGARLLGLWDQAHRYARQAAESARMRREAALEEESLGLLDKIANQEAGPMEVDPTDRDRLNRLRIRFEARLRMWDAPGRKQPGAARDDRRAEVGAA